MVVDDYLFLGVVFNYDNSFIKAVNRQLTLAKRALFALNSKISNLNLPVDLKLSLFDRLVIPVLTYGCEVWGFTNISAIERFQRVFLKNTLNISKYTASPIIYGETGFTEVELTINNRMINFWHRIRTDSTNKISVKMFKLIKHLFDENTFRSKWCNKINDILNNTGLSFLWNFDGVNSNQLKKIIKQQQLHSFSQNWNSAAYENSLCTNYRILAV